MADASGAPRRDPGWGHALKTGWADLLVPFPYFPLWRAERRGLDTLSTLRLACLSAIVTGALIVAVVWRVGSDDGGGSISPGLFLAGLLVYGVLDLALIAQALRRKPVARATEELAGAFSTVTLLGLSLAQALFLGGFVGAFVTGERAIVLGGIPFAVLGGWMAAPTRRRLAAFQAQVAAEGSSLDVVDVLARSPFRRGAAARGRSRTGEGTATRSRW